MGHSVLCPEIAEAYTAAEGANHQKAYRRQPLFSLLCHHNRLGLWQADSRLSGTSLPSKNSLLAACPCRDGLAHIFTAKIQLIIQSPNFTPTKFSPVGFIYPATSRAINTNSLLSQNYSLYTPIISGCLSKTSKLPTRISRQSPKTRTLP